MNYFLIAQIFGLLSLILAVVSIPQKSKNAYIIFYILQNVTSGIQYIFLNKLIAFYLCLICIFRLIVYYFRKKYSKWLNIAILIFFILLNLVISIVTFESWYDVFIIIGSTAICYTIWQEKVFVIRLGAIITKLMWGIYNIITRAYFSVLMDLLIILWTIFIIIKDYKKQQNKADKTKNVL